MSLINLSINCCEDDDLTIQNRTKLFSFSTCPGIHFVKSIYCKLCIFHKIHHSGLDEI